MANYVVQSARETKTNIYYRNKRVKCQQIQAIWANREVEEGGKSAWFNQTIAFKQMQMTNCVRWEVTNNSLLFISCIHSGFVVCFFFFLLLFFLLLFLTINSNSLFISVWYILYANLRACSHLLAGASIDNIAACAHCKCQTQTMRLVWHTHTKKAI